MWVPDEDGTPENSTTKPDPPRPQASFTGASSAAPPNKEDSGEYTTAELSRWKPGQLKGLLVDLGLDPSGCTDKRDIVERIARHPGGLAAAAAAATTRGDGVARRDSQRELAGDGAIAMGGSDVGSDGGGGGEDGGGGIKGRDEAGLLGPDATSTSEPQEEGENLIGMTLADYMSRPPADDPDAAEISGSRGRSQGHGADGGRERGGGRVVPSTPGSVNGGRPGSPSVGSATWKVRLAPAHIAPPSQPAPEWVVEMQVCVVLSNWGATSHQRFFAPHRTQEESLLLLHCKSLAPSKGTRARLHDVRMVVAPHSVRSCSVLTGSWSTDIVLVRRA